MTKTTEPEVTEEEVAVNTTSKTNSLVEEDGCESESEIGAEKSPPPQTDSDAYDTDLDVEGILIFTILNNEITHATML